MTLFKRAIAVAIMLSLLGVSTAWAFDGYGVDDAAHTHVAHESGSPLDDDATSCGHACHAGAHLFGLSFASGSGFMVAQRPPRPVMSAVSFLSITTDPLLKPPQS